MNNKLLKFLNEDSNIKEFYSKEKCISEFEQNSIEILNKSFIYIETQIKKIDDKFQIDVMKSKPKYG